MEATQGTSMYKCSAPDCRYVATVITNNHCEEEHAMSKNEIIAKYGKFEYVRNQSTYHNKEIYYHSGLEMKSKHDNQKFMYRFYK